jgi:two-component system, NarL family, nitrate/nitrite response regulator NarL
MSGRQARTRVLVVDDHPMYRDAVAASVRRRADLELVGAATDGREALELIAAERPDVAVLDIEMSGLDGMQVLKGLARDGSLTRVLVLSGHLESAIVYSALAAGARGYLSKDSGPDAICDAIATVARGDTLIPSEVHQGLLREIQLRADDDRPALSAREHEVLKLAAAGCSAPEMARRLYLGVGTVKTHLQSVYRKLGVSDRAAAVAEAMRQGLLE